MAKANKQVSGYVPSDEFARSCMLVTLNISVYQAKREDKKVSREVAQQKGATTDAGAYVKNLIPKESMEPITKAVSALRTFHAENSLPWLDDGVRVLPSANYAEYRAAFEPLRDAFDSAVKAFVTDWPTVVANAQQKLGPLFNASDYPADVATRFACRLSFRPLAAADDFRVNLTDSEKAILRSQIESDLQTAQGAATADLYRRLGENVKAMAERLRAYRVDPATGKTSGIFRDSLVENLRELVALIPRMNFAQDSTLEDIRRLVESELCAADATTLRDNDATRAKVAESAESIAERLGEFMAE